MKKSTTSVSDNSTSVPDSNEKDSASVLDSNVSISNNSTYVPDSNEKSSASVSDSNVSF